MLSSYKEEILKDDDDDLDEETMKSII